MVRRTDWAERSQQETAALAASRAANSQGVERDEATPRRLTWQGHTAVLALRCELGRWFVVAWFERPETYALAQHWRVVDPSGIERDHVGPRVRLCARNAPAWVVRLFDALCVVGESRGLPVIELAAAAERCA